MDVILDCVGGSYFTDNLSCLALDGVWVLYGLMGGVQVSGPVLGGTITINITEIKIKFYKMSLISGLLKKRASLKATTLRSRSDEYKSELVQSFSRDCLQHFEVRSYF